MEKLGTPAEASTSRGDPQVVETNCDRDVVKMAKLILADFNEISRQTAYALLRLAASRRK